MTLIPTGLRRRVLDHLVPPDATSLTGHTTPPEQPPPDDTDPPAVTHPYDPAWDWQPPAPWDGTWRPADGTLAGRIADAHRRQQAAIPDGGAPDPDADIDTAPWITPTPRRTP